jgi:hypothetical protein
MHLGTDLVSHASAAGSTRSQPPYDLSQANHENTFRKTRIANSEPAHNICFRGSSATNRLTIALAYYGNEPERSEPRQIFRV